MAIMPATFTVAQEEGTTLSTDTTIKTAFPPYPSANYDVSGWPAVTFTTIFSEVPATLPISVC